MEDFDYLEALKWTNDYINSFHKLYRLNISSNDEIDKFYQDIKNKFISTKTFSPSRILEIISIACLYNNNYIKSYWALFKKFYEEYQPSNVQNVTSIFDYFLFKEYGVILNEDHKKYFQDFEDNNYSLDIYEENTICKAIMNDNKELLVSILEAKGGDTIITIKSPFYPNSNALITLPALCCYHGAVNCFKLLITEYLHLITREYKFRPTVRCACYAFLGGNKEIISKCVKKKCITWECMKYAIIAHNVDFVTYLLNEYNIEINLNDCVAFQNIPAFLVNFDKTKEINKCLAFSSMFNYIPLCEFFISHGVDINARGRDGTTAFLKAFECDSKTIMEFLISRNADFNISNHYTHQTALHLAVIKNRKDLVEFLISHGANINVIDLNGLTPLFYSIQQNNEEIKDLLMSNGASIDFKPNEHGKHAIHIAAENDDLEMIQFLLSLGENINIKDKNGATPLHYAALDGCAKTVDFLVSHGADINAKDKDDKVPLHYTALRNYRECAKILISHGADLNAKDKDGNNPHHYAIARKLQGLEIILDPENPNLESE
ncbi:hypothetical protein TVAG_426250 [Trichomonas vaginalis G3]|uniref:DUF3447 domain-containing protein n=1 Tax=Trichomonas vaginalis (strain ATCC PRA-98 / G3) TaxID=412133 RepID=A2DYP2_TRIV3|nr:spectrin binding [Trichomonas vaginalis G3]EAY14432.1 hypothetical protein TVAG_426250 [Trichomonas vaginalis G3]KAI5499962.1 spectrin binding [Trichomonas vaginalis G3]|eukprot:XP_001326655.1 hypothetical protein [Trichomonas vaginalis G3]